MTSIQRHLASPGQQALWTFHRLNPTSPAYNMVLARELRAELDPERLCAAFALVLANYEALHCGYQEEDGQLWMVQPVRIEPDVATQRVENLHQTDVRAWLEQQADLPFELVRGQVCRLRLLHNQTASGPQLHMCAAFHHISGDFFSVEWAVELMFAVYEALQNGQPLSLPESGRYFDWLAEQREMQGGESNDALASFWQDRLAGAPAPLELTPDLPRPRSPSYAGEEFEQWLSLDDSQALRALAEQLNISLFGLLAGLFQVFMHRQSGQDDFLIGTPTMDRHKAKYKQLIGYTLNAIPLRARLKDNPRLDDYLRDSAKQLREGLRHRRLPLARIQAAAASPMLFRHMLTYMPNRREAALARFSLREHLATQRGAANELNLRWQDDGQRLQAQWRYSSELFRGERIARMAAQFVEFARAAVTRPTARLSELPACAPQEQSRLNGPALAPSAATALAAFTQQVAAHPQRLALIEGDASLSYAELDQAATRLAERFQATGLGAGGVVALALPRGTALLTAMLASWKAGAAYLCLDPALPTSRRLHMLGDSGAMLVAGLGPAPAELGETRWLNLDTSVGWVERSETQQPPPAKPIASAHPAQPAYLIYTSGSTGMPKGVVVSQGNLIHYVDGVLRALQLPDDASLSALATVAADLGYTAWFGALLSGRSLRLIDETLAADPEALAASLAEQPLDCLKIVPSHLKALLAVTEPARLLPRHSLVLGGEGLDLSLVQRIRELAPDCRVVNHYGPTETTVGCLSHGVQDLEPSLSGLVPVGSPLANVSVQVLDGYLNPLPQGSAGELYVGGAGVANGYLGQPRLSAERFIPDPFAADGSRLYRTGDRVRMLPNGLLEFLGRIDNQVKIRGFRVELGEVEACLKACPELRDAVVLAQPAASGDGLRLVAYLVAAQPIQLDELRQRLAKQLPDYMLPAVFVELAELPRLANGKVDRKNLPLPTETATAKAAEGAPRDGVEESLVQLWSALLQRESLSIHDDFFALGGDSILALQLIAKARQVGLKFSPKQLFAQPTIASLAATLDCPARKLEAQLLLLWRELLGQPELARRDDFFGQGGDSILALQLIAKCRQAGLKFSPKELFAHPSVAALAGLLLSRAPATGSAPAQAAAPRLAPFALSTLAAEQLRELAGAELEDAYPLSPLQKGLLFHSLLEGDSGVYVNQLQAELSGPFAPEPFLAAWRAAVAAHPLLRTGVLWQGLDEPVQAVYRQLELPVTLLDWNELDESARQRALDAYCQADRVQGFAPDRPPLQRLALIRLEEQRWWLVWSRHHLIADGWSSVLLLEEILTRYSGSTPAPRPAYRDYIGWLAAQPTQDATAFWQGRLQGFEGSGSLPMLAAPRPGQAVDYLTRGLSFDAAQTLRLNQAAKRAKVTLNTLIQAAWALLLARYNDQPDVIIGVTSSGRPSELPGADRMLGVFINTLPLRLQALPQLTLADFLRAVQDASVALREHEQTPLAEILQSQDRGAALFDTLLVFQNLPAAAERQLRVGELSLRALDNLEQTNYGLTLEALPGRQLQLLFSADAQRLPEPLLLALMDHMRQLLLAMDSPAATRLGQIGLLGAREQARLAEWGRHDADYSLEPDWQTRVAARVATHPERIVARCGDASLTYAQLWQRSEVLARGMRALGAQADQPVALLAERGLELLCLMVATLRAGAAWLPLEPTQPPARWQHVLNRANRPLVICNEVHRAALAEHYDGPIAVPAELLARSVDGQLPTTPARPEQLAYVLFTSGSTGQPKGVMVNRAGMLNNMLAKLAPLGLSEEDVIAQSAPACFDISVWQTLTAPLFGACVEIIQDAVVRDPQALLALLASRRISLLEPVPALLHALLEVQGERQVELPALRWVLPTGEALPMPTARAWFERYPAIPLMNAYGPAECSDDVAFHPLHQAPEEGGSVAIGSPTAGAELYVLGHDLNPLPVGVPGELAIGGIGVSRGYLADPARTAASFVPNPFGAPGSRLYLSGDLARWRADGVLEYLGRKDFQLKLRGFRIEPGEIEACLERHPAVQRALVNLQRLGESELLVAYWQGDDGAMAEEAELASYLRGELPAYMLPSAWVRVDSWPLNGNGKVDRKALPAPRLDSALIEPPQGETEQRLAELWAALLPPQALGRHSHFFEAGGHSLLATRLLARVRQAWAVDLPLRAVFEAPSLWQMAERLDALLAQPASLSTIPALGPVERSAEMPLSPSQQRLWLVDRLQGGAAYNMAATLSLDGELDVAVLQATFAALLQRHEVLRTAYPDNDGEPCAVISAHLDFHLGLRDLSQLPPAEREAEAQRESLANLRQPFDLSEPPLIRARLLKLGEQRHHLLLALHHMVADGWSVGVLFDELSQLYRSLRAAEPVNLAPLPLQYADYAAWQHRLLSGERLQRELGFWRTELAAAPQVLALPSDWPRPAQASSAGAAHAFRVPAALLERLEALVHTEGASLYMVLLSAFQLLLHRLSGSDDLLLGTDVAGREARELEGLIGFFVNVLPLRSRLQPRARFVDLLAATKRTCLAAFEHQTLPFERIVEALEVPRDRSRNPLVQALFVMQNTPQSDFAIPGLAIQLQPPAERSSKFDMALFLEREGGDLCADWVYASALFKAERIAALADAWVAVLEQAVAAPQGAVAAFTFTLPQSEPSCMAKNPPSTSKLDKLKKLAPRTSAAPRPLIKTRPLMDGRDFPLLIEPATPDLDPVGWARSSRDLIDTLLCRHAGLLLRGFALHSPQDFEAFAEAIHPGLFGGYGDLPKKEGGRNIYRSTPYPEREMILYHNESSHLPRAPRKQWFFCEQPSPVGGATPIVDCRELYRRLPTELAQTFESKGLLYVRTFTKRLDVSWQEFFKTDERAEVEAQCRASGTEFVWLANDELQTRTRCPAVIRHPLSGERSFFNQVQLHHVHCLEPEVREDLLALVGLERMPRHVYFGDGSSIDDEVMALLGRLYEECAVRFDWQRGDVVMLDNLLAAHARDPYEGPRKIAVAMGDLHEPAQLLNNRSEMELQN
ncbi:non-ribosomal peptide synthetase [Pseudomonas anguilliseptica]|uniref:Amino acid adenylation domain-containing protein n=1 Tax=Pseudomonas anguilliseptica TaxID=53406 RepID=A0A1H5BUY2_PSEAG|nr:non-ribosomal peptide synthetase [Pseudomonas anguilliseptica]SED57850.1 amino acid adenylation domain-containing protein [Pseudomonas anguilliseptica]